MNPRRIAVLCALSLAQAGGVALAAGRGAGPAEHDLNAWPVLVGQRAPDAGNLHTWNGAGPLLFSQPNADRDGNTASGFRPFWVEFHRPGGELRAGHLLYPLFSYTQDETTYRWSFFELIRRQGRRAEAGPPQDDFEQRHEFEIFPFWFQREFAEPELDYRALFPIYGTIRQKLGIERLSWTLFPFYVESERRGAVTTYSPWPFIRVTRGEARGWGVWPLYTTVERPGVSQASYFLWPLGYQLTKQPAPDDPPGTPPRRDFGALPFYARSSGPGFVSESYAWPFFGYTERTQPARYSERRYFWPFFVQAQGEQKQVNRWAPFYTHSVVKGYDKQWVAWPLFRQAQWTDEGVERTRRQFLYFLFWQEEQRAAGRSGSPSAELTHLWPLYSQWDNGAGHRQWQLLSPLEVFFPGNTKVRQVWSPLLSLARRDERPTGDTRTSLLWNAVTWEKRVAEDRQEFHLGPLLGVTRAGAAKRIAIGNGLFGFHRPAEGGWRLFWLDFPEKSAGQPTASR